MSEKRKTIFREALFIVPFMLIVTVVSLAFMFSIGRTPLDMSQIIERHSLPDSSMTFEEYSGYESTKYTIKYYYGDNEECVKYAEYSYNGKGDKPVQKLTLFETRDGFDPGFYKIEWFHGEEYVTYAALENEEKTELYGSGDVPVMYNLVLSYSWQSQMQYYGGEYLPSEGYKLLGFISLYTWDTEDRDNVLWGIGGNPMQFYSYIKDTDNEYKRISFY